MTLAQKRYQQNQELVTTYISKHPELESFTNSLKEMQNANSENRRTKMTVRVGELTKKGFLSCLTSSIKNPIILFADWREDDNVLPQIIIRNRANIVACFTLEDVKIISSEIENDDGSCIFDRYSFVVRIDDKFDYDMTMVIYKNHEYTA